MKCAATFHFGMSTKYISFKPLLLTGITITKTEGTMFNHGEPDIKAPGQRRPVLCYDWTVQYVL